MSPVTKKAENVHRKIDPAEPAITMGPSLDSHVEEPNTQVSDDIGTAALYKPLKKAPSGWQEIRLFSLLPNISCSTIRGHLFQARIKDDLMDGSVEVNFYSACNPAYEALSYVWGDREEGRQIFLNGIPFRVTQNLYAALAQLRLFERERVLWIDAICINQNDDDEKSTQVTFMRQIYEAASQVLIWLGDESPHASEGIRELRNLFNTKPPHATARYLFAERPSHGVRDVLARPWWGRVWVVQEAAVARKLAFLCGPNRLDLPHSRHDLLELADAFQKALTSGALWLAFNSVFLEQFLALIRNQWNNIGDAKSKLIDLIDTNLLRQCSDHRDRVFAFLGLSETHDATRNAPDYALTIEEVTVRLLCNSAYHISTNSDSTSERAGLGTNETEITRQIERICQSLVGRNRENRIFSASGSSNINVRWHNVQGILLPVLSGIVVDTIGDSDGVQSYKDLNSSRSDEPSVLVGFTKFLDERLIGSRTGQKRCTERWKYAISSNGRKAIVPRRAKPGDQVCIITGFPLPFILRPAEDRTFNILGECYVHGVMHGEAVQYDAANEIFQGDHWSWSNGTLRRRRRYGMSFGSGSRLGNVIRGNVWVAHGLKIQDIVLKDWITPPSQEELEGGAT